MVDWIQTFTGRQFFPLAPDPAALDIRDIAHALAHLCRFNGHCRSFYSVADHCLRVSRIVPPEHALWGLLHDAAEAYLADVPRPVKYQIPAYRDHEAALERVIAARFELPWPMPPAVKHADNVLLATEKRDLMAPEPAPWHLTAEPLPDPIVPLAPAAAREAFLARFAALRA